MKPVHIKEGLRIFSKSLKRKLHGFKTYSGNPEEICKQIINNCWNKKHQYFQTSAGHFCQFYTRDFTFCAESLIKLNQKEKVLKTLNYALTTFSTYNKITTSITPKGKPFDFPYYAIDSTPLLIHTLKLAKANKLISEYEGFLNKEIDKLFQNTIDKKTGLVRKDKYFSSIKDYAKRKSSCYDNCMIAMLAKDIKNTNLNNPFKKYNYPKLIKKYFWNQSKSYFLDDLSGTKHIAADANIFPFWTGTFTDKSMLKKALQSVDKTNLNKPFPLKYTSSEAKPKMILTELLVRNYEKNNIWTHMGPLYINLLKQTNLHKAKTFTSIYTSIIQKHKTFLEVFNNKGKPFNTLLYKTDEGMLWACNYLTLK